MKIEELKVSYNPKQNWTKKPLLNRSCLIADYIRPKFKSNISFKEYIWIILLTRSLRPKGAVKVGEGGINGCVSDIRIILAIALKTLSPAFVLIHNHPSGNCSPSVTDKKLTKEIAKAAKIMNIDLVDHIILTQDSHYSFSEGGLL